MTARHCAYVVTLDRDIREDDAEPIIEAIRMIRFVAKVEPVTASPSAEAIGATRRDVEWRAALDRLRREGPTP